MTKQYLTPQGLEKMKSDLEHLKNNTRKEITSRIEDALKLGDLSENAEYHEAKEAQGLNEAKIRELDEILKDVEVIEANTTCAKSVGVGCQIQLQMGKDTKEFTLVGTSEANPGKGFISNESPIGQALMGRCEGDDVEVQTPAGKNVYKIVKIK